MTSRFQTRSALIAFAETAEKLEALIAADAADDVTDAVAATYIAAFTEIERIASEALAEKRRAEKRLSVETRIDSGELRDLIANDGETPADESDRVSVMEGEGFR